MQKNWRNCWQTPENCLLHRAVGTTPLTGCNPLLPPVTPQNECISDGLRCSLVLRGIENEKFLWVSLMTPCNQNGLHFYDDIFIYNNIDRYLFNL